MLNAYGGPVWLQYKLHWAWCMVAMSAGSSTCCVQFCSFLHCTLQWRFWSLVRHQKVAFHWWRCVHMCWWMILCQLPHVVSSPLNKFRMHCMMSKYACSSTPWQVIQSVFEYCAGGGFCCIICKPDLMKIRAAWGCYNHGQLLISWVSWCFVETFVYVAPFFKQSLNISIGTKVSYLCRYVTCSLVLPVLLGFCKRRMYRMVYACIVMHHS